MFALIHVRNKPTTYDTTSGPTSRKVRHSDKTVRHSAQTRLGLL